MLLRLYRTVISEGFHSTLKSLLFARRLAKLEPYVSRLDLQSYIKEFAKNGEADAEHYKLKVEQWVR